MTMTAGVSNPAWSGRRVTEALEFVKRLGRKLKQPCSLCGQPINYDLEYPDPDSCSVQHVKPQSLFPLSRWDPNNWAPSHLQCNQSAGTADSLGLGVTSFE
ncbi:HNH endonuclease [Brevibacterium sp.]|uniref:HNH endonuclease n=1 Tax=Brevibacterium sp. TaxID=1701 RepID=UPI00281280C7|nr:HNH endonuclease [Brevibacterium sp.]